jgi:YidC/Oxa1 family membrane protein insertase
MQSDFIRLLLWGALLSVALLLWNAWHVDYPSSVETRSPTQTNTQAVAASLSNPVSAALKGVPQVSGKLIHLRTDVFEAAIDPVGGNLMSLKLLKYRQEKDHDKPINLLNPESDTFYMADSSLVSSEFKGPLVYKSEEAAYQLADKQDTLLIKLSAKAAPNLLVEKTFTFKKDNYLIDVDYQLHNASSQPFVGYIDERLVRKKVPAPSKGIFHINPYIGAAYSTPDHPFEKLTFEDMEKSDLNQEVKAGWISMLQLYFLSAWIPDASITSHFYTRDLGNSLYAVGMQNASFTIAPNANYNAHTRLYVGPAIANVLHGIAPHLGLAVNYGWLWFISEWLFWLLQKIHVFVGNWGWSIVLLTAAIKLAFYHLSATSYRSMARMRQLQPRLEALKDRYGDDRQKLMQETMALYKKEKVNPMGGCLPILVQIPVFIALYWVLLESVELYQAPFILWIHDLSAPDPYYVLPSLMGVTMLVQQKLSPPPPDPTQEKIMLLMPVVFTALFLYFPAGLVLYWVVNNILSISQQWYITRHYKPEKKWSKSK